MNKINELKFLRGQLIVIIGFMFYGVTSVVYMIKEKFNYYFTPYFVISIIVMIIGLYLWIKDAKKEFSSIIVFPENIGEKT